MKFGFYAYDVGPSKVLKMVADAAQERGHEVLVIPPQIRGVANEYIERARECDVFAIGFASFQTQEELALVESMLVPVVVIEDVPRSAMVPGAKEFARQAAGVVTSIPSMEPLLKEFGYWRVMVVGPAPHWGQSYTEMVSVRDIRKSFKKRLFGEIRALTAWDRVLFIEGMKDPIINNRILSAVLEAGGPLLEEALVLGFKSHPGEKPESPEEEEIFRKALEERKSFFEKVWVLESNSSLPQIIAGSDLTIFHGGPNESIVAAYARINAAYYYDELVQDYLVRSGRHPWCVLEFEGAYKIDGPDRMREAIKTLLAPEGQLAVRRKQEENFPLPESWDTAPLIVDFLEDVAR